MHELPEGYAPGLVEDVSPERVLLARETLAEVLGALAELEDRTRDIFILSRLENLPQREIAALYGISVSAVEKHVAKAVLFLASDLGEFVTGTNIVVDGGFISAINWGGASGAIHRAHESELKAAS